jgi:hypothetical protein
MTPLECEAAMAAGAAAVQRRVSSAQASCSGIASAIVTVRGPLHSCIHNMQLRQALHSIYDRMKHTAASDITQHIRLPQAYSCVRHHTT